MVNIYQNLSHVGDKKKDVIIWCYKMDGEWL